MTNFNTPEWHKMMNTPNVWSKYFNGMSMYEGKEVTALSKKLGFEEFGKVLDYKKEGNQVCVFVEFLGDNGIWKEWVNVKDCKAFNPHYMKDFTVM
jgi:hypothetical protein